MNSWSERMTSHTGTGTRPRLLREAAVGILRNGETLTQRRHVRDEGFRVVNLCQEGRNCLRLIPSFTDGTSRGSTG